VWKYFNTYNTYKTNTDPFMLQKRAIRIVKKTPMEPANSLFIELKALKFKEVQLKTLQIMYKAKKNH